jgi:hypothetical protein
MEEDLDWMGGTMRVSPALSCQENALPGKILWRGASKNACKNQLRRRRSKASTPNPERRAVLGSGTTLTEKLSMPPSPGLFLGEGTGEWIAIACAIGGAEGDTPAALHVAISRRVHSIGCSSVYDNASPPPLKLSEIMIAAWVCAKPRALMMRQILVFIILSRLFFCRGLGGFPPLWLNPMSTLTLGKASERFK